MHHATVMVPRSSICRLLPLPLAAFLPRFTNVMPSALCTADSPADEGLQSLSQYSQQFSSEGAASTPSLN